MKALIRAGLMALVCSIGLSAQQPPQAPQAPPCAAADPQFVLRWRVEAEEKVRASGRGSLNRAAIEDYVRRFLPAYATWGGPPPNIARDRRLDFVLDERRRAIQSHC